MQPFAPYRASTYAQHSLKFVNVNLLRDKISTRFICMHFLCIPSIVHVHFQVVSLMNAQAGGRKFFVAQHRIDRCLRTGCVPANASQKVATNQLVHLFLVARQSSRHFGRMNRWMRLIRFFAISRIRTPLLNFRSERTPIRVARMLDNQRSKLQN